MGCAAGAYVAEIRPGPERVEGGARSRTILEERIMGQGASLLDLLVALLQSIVVLLLASGVYVALVVRRPGSRASGPAAHHRHLVLDPDVEARHVDDHALVRPVADRLLLVGDHDAERHRPAVDL